MKPFGTVGPIRRRLRPAPPVSRSPAQHRLLDAEATRSARPSILFFTTHKCASTFVSKLLSALEAESDLRHFDYAGGAYSLGDEIETGDVEHTDIERVIEARHAMLFHPTGEIYGPLRRPVDFPGRAECTQIFFLRDPRDVLVSAYYSFGFSHGEPPNAKMRALFLAERARIREEGIDRFALRMAESWLAPALRSYAAYRDEGRDTHYLTYDDYKDDPAAFISTLCELLDITVPQAMIDRLAEQARPIQSGTGPETAVATHKRSGRSGQFMTELSGQTLAALDEILGDGLDAWEFARTAAR